MSRQPDQALEEFHRAIAIEPDHLLVNVDIARAYAQKGMYKEGVSQLERVRTFGADPGASATGEGWLGYAYALAGQRSDALRILDGLQERSKRTYVSPLNIAMIYTGLGDRHQAFQWLEKAYQVRDVDLVLLNVYPIWDPLRSDPRFQDLVRRMNFPQ